MDRHYQIECSNNYTGAWHWLTEGDVPVTFATYREAAAKRDALQAQHAITSPLGYRVREVTRG